MGFGGGGAGGGDVFVGLWEALAFVVRHDLRLFLRGVMLSLCVHFLCRLQLELLKA